MITCTWAPNRDVHTFASPPHSRLTNLTSCPSENEFAQERVPITHVVDMHRLRSFGLWFYLARGCSNLTYSVGRTLVAHNRLEAALRSAELEGCAADCAHAELLALRDSAYLDTIRNTPNATLAHAVRNVRTCPAAQTRAQAYLYGDPWSEQLVMDYAMDRFDTAMLLRQPTGNFKGKSKFHTEIWMLSTLHTAIIHEDLSNFAGRFYCRHEPCRELRIVDARGGGCLVCDDCTEHCIT